MKENLSIQITLHLQLADEHDIHVGFKVKKIYMHAQGCFFYRST